jgi:hypothetical protein
VGHRAFQHPGLVPYLPGERGAPAGIAGRSLLVLAQDHDVPATGAAGGQAMHGRGEAAGHPPAPHDPGAAAQRPLDPRERFG